MTVSESGSLLLFSHKLALPDPKFHLLSEYPHRSRLLYLQNDTKAEFASLELHLIGDCEDGLLSGKLGMFGIKV